MTAKKVIIPVAPAKAKKTVTIYESLILDRSGSMIGFAQSVRDSVNSYINKVKETSKKTKQETFLSLVQFNHMIDHTATDQPVAKVAALTKENYTPSNQTAHNDAVAGEINRLRNVTKNKKNTRVLITIFTDGYENASKDYPGTHNPKFKELITRAEKEWGFTIVFVGANMDVQERARSTGIKINNTMSFQASAGGASAAFDMLSVARTAYSASAARGVTLKSAGYFTVGK